MLPNKRKKLGAFYTPNDLARLLVDWAIDRKGMSVLEPSVGQGALIEAVLAKQSEHGGGRIAGLEIHQPTWRKVSAKFQGSPVEVVKADFLDASPADMGLFDAVVANPPFTRNHSLSKSHRNALRSRKTFQNVVQGAPGLWVYFILHSLQFLKPNGRLAFITPGAVLFADYAAPVLEALRKSFASVELVSVDGKVDWEGAAQERAALLLAKDYRGRAPSSEGGHSSTRKVGVEYSRQKTSKFSLPASIEARATTLGQIANLEIGVVTGANAFFLLDKKLAERSKIPGKDLRPIAARARHVQGLCFGRSDARELAKAGERTLLVYTKGAAQGPTARYFAKFPKAERDGVLWFSKRKPWWRVQLGNPCDAVFTYMNGYGPHLTLVDSEITCTNTLHRVVFGDRSVARMRTACVSILSTYSQLQAEKIGRVYGGGVLKFELKDARALRLLMPKTSVTKANFLRIDKMLRSGEIEKARMYADRLVLSDILGEAWEVEVQKMGIELSQLRARRGAGKRREKAGA